MALSPDALKKILEHNSSTLCNSSGDRLLNEYKVSGDLDAEPVYFSDSEKPMPNSFNESTVKKSRMPDIIKESFASNPLDQSVSITDQLGINVKRPNNAPTVSRKQAITENYQQAYGASQNVDYSIIKAIVKECLNEYFSKQPINEGNTLQQIGLSEGKIKLVDNKGNVFASKLSYIGNINDKKKGS